MSERLSNSDDATIRAALNRWGHGNLSVETFKSWEADLPEGQRLVIDIFGDFFVEGGEVVKPFIPPL